MIDMLDKVLDKIKEITDIEKIYDTITLIDTDDKLPDDITLKMFWYNKMRYKIWWYILSINMYRRSVIC